ncbi:MAG: serine hydrolase domain-containing protein [Gemmatimonadaceae bacterium]
MIANPLRLAIAAALLAPFALGAQQPDLPSRIDKIFARFDRNTPGCAVGVAKDGRTLYTHGYGSANLEYGVPLTDSSVMESGSVAKQFTAAALVLLQQDGKLSLDDDIRKYLPEVPDFGRTITIRNLLTHTSGLRDQWGLLSIEGRGPGTQVHSPETTLDLVTHQHSLNFPPGSAYLYSNTGYALAGIIVQRVSGKSLRDFSQERLFGPLGMTHTQWRDDFTRVVANRATAYSPAKDGYRQDMPFTNMIGNGGLLSTMDDLLKWNENLDRTTVGGPTLTPTLETRMQLTNGRLSFYALGLGVIDYDGVREVSHNGSTAGYKTVLARYPDQHVSVAVWCSNGGVNAGSLGHQVADLVLIKPTPIAKATDASIQLSKAALAQWAGLYRDPVTNQVMNLVATETSLTAGGANALVPLAATRFRMPNGEASFNRTNGKKSFVLVRAMGDSSRFEEIANAPAKLTLSDYTGRYVSDELDVELRIIVRDGKLMLLRRPEEYLGLTPSYLDSFASPIGSLRFSRDARGRASGFAIFSNRALDIRFKRVR